MKYFVVFILLIQILYVQSPIPNWDITSQSIDLLSSSSTYEYPIYSKTAYDITVTLKKKITKSGSSITTQNYLTVDGTTKTVDFDDIDSQYTNMLGVSILICPRGKFHPYNFNNNSYVIHSEFEDKGGWDLRCYHHYQGYFFVFYLSNNGRNFYFKYDSDSIKEVTHISTYFYDYKLENGNNVDNYEYKFSYLRYNTDNNLYLVPGVLILNNDDNTRYPNYNALGSWRYVAPIKDNTQGSFDSSHNFYFLTYSSTTDFSCGYSNTYVNFNSKSEYESCIQSITTTINSGSPLTFVDNVEIKEMKFITGTKYAYYKIYNSDKNINYYGLISTTDNKVLYNFGGDITSFIPITSAEKIEILAITSTSAYKVCIIKSGSSCLDYCSNSNLMLDPNGNKCQSDCDSGKIKFMAEGICLNKSLCDTNYYTLNSDETQCGLCSYFYPSGSKYKLVNTPGCLSTIPDNTEYYNENLYLLKCKTDYSLNTDNECVPDHCYDRCATCSEIGTDIDNQKCSTCKEGYSYDNGNCIVSPTTIIIPPTTVLPPTTVTIPPTTEAIPPTTETIPPTTITIPPTTETIPPTTVTIPPTTETIPPTTITIPPTTEIIPPTTEVIPPTTIIPPTTEVIPPTTIIPPPTTIITEAPTEIKILETCTNKKCQTCNEESDKDGLCLSCDENQYKKVNYTNKYSKYFNCFKEKDLEYKYYKDIETNQYKPCFQLCKKCLGPGNATHHNCLECMENYMFRPEPNPHNNCVVYSQYYYRSAYNEYKTLDSPLCPKEAKYTIKDDNNKTSCIFSCKVDKIYKYLYSGYCVKQCPNNTNDTDYICQEDPQQIYISSDSLSQDINITVDNIEVLVEAYAYEFYYTDNHVSSLEGSEANILIYKNPNIISQTNLKAPNIDFGECYELVKQAYNITGNLIISIIDKKVKNNPSTFYLFFHPETGKKLDTSEICKNKSIKVEENLLNMLDENSQNYELQVALTKQGINIFDINDPYYKDICYDFENPKNRDMALKDRIKETYINVTLCDDGCVNTGIDVKSNVATCDCKFNEITNNDLIHENAALDFLVGEIFDLVNSSNILVLKCYKYLLKYFTRSKGGIIIGILLALCVIFTGVFFSFELTKMKRYIFSLTEKYTSFLANYGNIFKLFPPRKSIKNKTSKNDLLKFERNTDSKTNIKKNIHSKKKQNTIRTVNPYSQSFKKSSKDVIFDLNNKNIKLNPTKEKPKEEKIDIYMEEGKKIKKFFKEYLATSIDEMEFDDAIKKDERGFCSYFLDTLQEKQSIAYTFIASDPINTRMIKFILFSLNLALYFVVNGLFFSESFISELYHTKEDENFLSFIPRTIDKVIYTTIVTSFISYMTDFFFLNENKIKGIFKREKDNRLVLKRSITMLIREIQKRYISFIIMTFVILVISLYYILCFNYVYPKTQIEWVKSSIFIIIIMQILSVLKCLYEAIFRTLAFKCESEKLYKLAKIFENNS